MVICPLVRPPLILSFRSSFSDMRRGGTDLHQPTNLSVISSQQLQAIHWNNNQEPLCLCLYVAKTSHLQGATPKNDPTWLSACMHTRTYIAWVIPIFLSGSEIISAGSHKPKSWVEVDSTDAWLGSREKSLLDMTAQSNPTFSWHITKGLTHPRIIYFYLLKLVPLWKRSSKNETSWVGIRFWQQLILFLPTLKIRQLILFLPTLGMGLKVGTKFG